MSGVESVDETETADMVERDSVAENALRTREARRRGVFYLACAAIGALLGLLTWRWLA
jgi:hypothetical protein